MTRPAQRSYIAGGYNAFRDVLPAALMIVAVPASRAKAGLEASRAWRSFERVTGTVLVALGLRVAID